MQDFINTIETTEDNRKKLELFLINSSLSKDGKKQILFLIREMVNTK